MNIPVGSIWQKKADPTCVVKVISVDGKMVELEGSDKDMNIVRGKFATFRFMDEYTRIDVDIDPSKELNITTTSESTNPTDLKTDVTKLEDFGTGAKREDKSGKGRYDLIPGDIMNAVEDYAYKQWFVNGVTTVTDTDVSESAYFDDWTDIEAYYEFICNMICNFFAPTKSSFTSDCGEITGEYSWNGFRVGLITMRKALAKHYEDGAKIHGVDNWKKGLPIYGSGRGGCFLDSMRRHTDQALAGMVDEPHAIAAIWNAFGAAWTLKHKPYCAVYQNSSEVKAEDKSTSIPKLMTIDEWEKLFLKFNGNPKDMYSDRTDALVDSALVMDKIKHTSSTPEILEWLESDYVSTNLPVRDDAIRFMHYNLERCHEFLLKHVQDWVDGKRSDSDTIFTEYAFLTYLLDDRLEEFIPVPELRHAVLAIVRTGYNILMRDGFKGNELYVVAVPDDYKYDKRKIPLSYDKMIIDTCAQIIRHSNIDKWRGYDLIRPFVVIQNGLKPV